jgi:hypothetical protein
MTARDDIPARDEPLDPDMPAQQLRLHMGEMTAQEMRTARAAIRWANTRLASRPAPHEADRDRAAEEERIREDERDRLYARAENQGGLTGQIAAAWLLGADAMPAASRAALRSTTTAEGEKGNG